MRTPPPAQAATDLRTFAAVLLDGRWARALELADAAGSPLRAAGGGRASVGDHSDPTGAAAFARPDPVPTVAALVSAYDAVRHAICGTRPASHAWVAGKLQGEATLLTSNRSHADYGLLWACVDRALRLHSATITPAAAAAHMQERAASRIARYCVVCEAPLTDADRRSMCGPDYWLWRDRAAIRHLFTTQPEGDPGSDRAHFVTWMRARIADPLHVDNHGVSVPRPGSPWVPDAAPMVRADGVA